MKSSVFFFLENVIFANINPHFDHQSAALV